VCVLLIALVLLGHQTDLKPQLGNSLERSGEFYNFSIPLAFKNIGTFLYSRIDWLMIGLFLTQSNVGIYKVALILSSLIVMPLTAFNQLFPPVASRLYSSDKTAELQAVYQTVTRWTLTVALVPALGILIYRRQLLGVFGTEFTAGASVLVLLTVAKLTNCAVGPCGYVLMMTEHQYLNLINQWVLGILNAVLNYVLIVNYGFIGAAIATASVLAGINILRVVEVWYTEQLLPYSKAYWKPVAASIGAASVMFGWQFVLSNYVLLFVGGTTGFLTFAILLFAFGIEETDRDFFFERIEVFKQRS
jgi:O-antigen/teichoic acid export membrane protein